MKSEDYYRCPTCGVCLDPGEECEDCKNNGFNTINTFAYPSKYDKVNCQVKYHNNEHQTDEESYRHSTVTSHTRLPKCDDNKIKTRK